MLALVVPERVPSRRYLGWLALVARMLRDDATVEAVRQAEAPGQAHAALLGALILVAGQFVFERLLGSQSALAVIVELFGGLLFLVLVLKRRRR